MIPVMEDFRKYISSAVIPLRYSNAKFNLSSSRNVVYNLPDGFSGMLSDAIRGHLVRDRINSFMPNVSYLFGCYLHGGFKPHQIKFRCGLLRDYVGSSFVNPRMFSSADNPLLVLLGYVENDPNYRVTGDSVVITNTRIVTRLMDDNGWKYVDAGNLLVIPNVSMLFDSVKDFSLDLFLGVNDTLKRVMDIIVTSVPDVVETVNLDSLIKWFPGFVFHRALGGSWPFSDYKSLDLRVFIRGRQGESDALVIVNKYMRDLVDLLGLYDNEYSLVHVLVGVEHYDIPVISDDLAYIFNKFFDVGIPLDDLDRYRVWDNRDDLRDKMLEFFNRVYEELL